MAKQLKENEMKRLRKMVADEILRLQTNGDNPMNAAKNLIEKAAAAGMQYSKAAKDFIKSEMLDQLGYNKDSMEDAEVIEPTIVGSDASDDSQKIGESENIEGIKVEHTDNIKKAESARKRFKLEDAFNMEKGSDGKTKVSFKLPQNEEEFGDLIDDIIPHIKNNGVKGIVNAVSHTIITGLKEEVESMVSDGSDSKSNDCTPGVNSIFGAIFKGLGL